MSFPPGIEMFQFPGFASPPYVFRWRYPKGVGCPIRISTDQSLLAAPRGFSQRATSFVASWCQGIHRMPFSRSRSRRHVSQRASTMHRNHPQWSVVSAQWSENVLPDQTPIADAENDPVQDHLAQHTTDASEHIATVAGGPLPHEKPSQETDHIRSDMRPRRAQRRTRT